MEVRGERECKACETQWSYFETGSVECPDCGSMRSVGVGERALQTDGAAELDLDDARSAAADDLRGAFDPAVEACREYCQSRGFVAGGDLLDLDDIYLAAQELRRAALLLGDAMRVGDDEEAYVLALLKGADSGDRPEPEEVPESLRAARGLGYAAAVRAYRADVRTYADSLPDAEQRLHERLGSHVKRIRALDGDVPAEDAERLVLAARRLGDAVCGDEAAVEQANAHLDGLE